MKYSNIELSEGNTSLWITSPLNARVRIANVIQHSPMNGIDSQAYARLFAAAPDLLSALEDHKEWLETGKVDGVSFDNETALDALRAAIAKARGDQ